MSLRRIVQCLLVSVALPGLARIESLATTTPADDPVCSYDGRTYGPGDEYKRSPCETCVCIWSSSSQSMYESCINESCTPDVLEWCGDVQEPQANQCCPTCAYEKPTTTQFCYYEGLFRYFTLGEQFWAGYCTRCTCKWFGSPQIVCDHPCPEDCFSGPIQPDECCETCNTEDVVYDQLCEDFEGQQFKPGQTYQPEPCHWCVCDPLAVQENCSTPSQCAAARCVNPILNLTDCCLYCPSGPSCKHGDIEILEGETLLECGMTCLCEPYDLAMGFLIAKCVKPRPKDILVQPAPLPSPIPDTTRPPLLATGSAAATLGPKEVQKQDKRARLEARKAEQED